ncbi:hypothetical protein BHM03_00052727 [Ensete ventricosum]|nr:hypothetical protein BHM03_00052727 [Ensete ventricosum]
MRWDLARSSLGDSPKESRRSLGTRREIAGKKTRGLAARLPAIVRVCGNNGPRSSLGIGPSSDDAVGSRREFAKRFVEGIRMLARNMKGDHRKKTRELTARMPEATGLAEVRSKLSLWLLSVLIVES